MAYVVWTKSYSSSDDGSILTGAQLGNLQADIAAVLNGGISNINVAADAAIDSTKVSGTLSSYTVSFTNATLSSGVLTVTHNLGIKVVIVSVYDNSDKQIIPDEITLSSTTALTVNLSSFGTLTGTWNVRVGT